MWGDKNPNFVQQWVPPCDLWGQAIHTENKCSHQCGHDFVPGAECAERILSPFPPRQALGQLPQWGKLRHRRHCCLLERSYTYVCIYSYIRLCISVSVYLSVLTSGRTYLYPCVYLYLYLVVCISVSVCLCLSLCQCPPPSPSPSHLLSLCLHLYLCLCRLHPLVYIYIYVCISVCFLCIFNFTSYCR